MPAGVELHSLDGSGREGGHVVEMQRRRLLLAFSEIAVKDGLERTGVGRVCAHAGVSRRTFYELFEDREGCFLAVLDSSIERLAHRVLPAYEGDGAAPDGAPSRARADWRERVRDALTVLLECLDEEPVLARICLGETLKGGPPVLERRRHTLDLLAAIVDQGRVDSKDGVSAPRLATSPSLTAQGVVGGVVSVLHTRVLEDDRASLVELVNPLMSMIVLPYLGPAAARGESVRPTPKPIGARNGRPRDLPQDPFKDLPIRLTFRTARVLATVGAQPGASNRRIGDVAGVPDQGQISKLLRRLEHHGLIHNDGEGHTKGEPNAWHLTPRGSAIQHAIETPAA